MMGRFFTFNGRINRAAYFGYSLLFGLIPTVIGLITFYTESIMLIILHLILTIVMFIPTLCITIQRFHDIERPGYHYFLGFIPFYNIYLGLVLLFKRGTNGSNKYGKNPLS